MSRKSMIPLRRMLSASQAPAEVESIDGGSASIAPPTPPATKPRPQVKPPTNERRTTAASRHKAKRTGQTLYLDPAVDRKLREMLLARDGEISAYTNLKLRKHDLLLEAIDLLLKANGEKSILDLIEAASTDALEEE